MEFSITEFPNILLQQQLDSDHRKGAKEPYRPTIHDM